MQIESLGINLKKKLYGLFFMQSEISFWMVFWCTRVTSCQTPKYKPMVTPSSKIPIFINISNQISFIFPDSYRLKTINCH